MYTYMCNYDLLVNFNLAVVKVDCQTIVSFDVMS